MWITSSPRDRRIRALSIGSCSTLAKLAERSLSGRGIGSPTLASSSLTSTDRGLPELSV